jgi:cyclopropane fatty-acyl-phospholipid synthase-like methyltransferase
MRVLLFLLLSGLIGFQQAQQRRDPVEYIKTLESERRVEALQVPHVVESLKLKQGQRIADLGSGSGLFTRPLARAIGSNGVCYAIDIDPELLKHVDKTAKDAGINNVRTVLAGESDPKIPEPVDLIAIFDTLHHIDGRPAYLANLRKYLKPQGRIAIIDFSETWPAGHENMRYTLADLEGWMKSAGYTRVEKLDFLNNNFFVIYKAQ